jgi:iron complex outermembrane receptor protein
MQSSNRIRAVAYAVSILVATQTSSVWAQDNNADKEVTVIGTRANARTALDSMVPIDIIGKAALEQTAASSLTDALAVLAPSFSVQTLPALDATIFVRPARLRNLSPDQTLVLINGKRMHRSAMMMNPSYGSAFQAADLDQIASSAIKSIDVLRDGASAQYGSDAIAGVININLTDSLKWSGFAQAGKYFAGDGPGNRIGFQGGFGEPNAFLAIAVENSKDGFTSRANQSSNAAASQAAFPALSFPNPDVHWGNPDREALRFAFNGAIKNPETTLYTFGSLGQGSGVGDFNYRGPVGSYASIFAANAAFPGWTLKQVYPTGFTPRFKSNDDDMSFYMGVKSNPKADDMKWDLSYGMGSSKIDYSMSNSINASLGPASPTSFYDGGVKQVEQYINLDVSKAIAIAGLEEPAVLAGGAEVRNEKFSINAGDAASYAFGPGAPSLSCCSAGFPGYSPLQAISKTQTSKSLYTDLFMQLNQQLSVDGALRYEQYDAFGDSLTYKLSTRYDVKPFALRGTASTGFRAPTTAQLYSEGLSQFLPSATSPITTLGRFSPVGPVAKVLNQRSGVAIVALKPEESENFSIGAVWDNKSGLSASLDFFKINVTNRLNSSAAYTLTTAENAALTALNIPNLQNIYQASFLQNDFNTTTQGFEFVLQDTRNIANGKLNSSFAFSQMGTEVTGGTRATNPYSKQMYEDSLPKNRATLSSTYITSSWEFMARARYYGSWSDWTDAFPSSAKPGTTYPVYAPQVFGGITLGDIAVTYLWDKNTRVTFGADNLFDVYPDKSQSQTFRGLIYSRNAPYSTSGGYYYTKLTTKF